MMFKKDDILQFHYGIDHPDCKIIYTYEYCGDRWVYMVSTEGTYITYSRSYLVSEIASGRISFKRYGKELKPSFMVKKLLWV